MKTIYPFNIQSITPDGVLPIVPLRLRAHFGRIERLRALSVALAAAAAHADQRREARGPQRGQPIPDKARKRGFVN